MIRILPLFAGLAIAQATGLAALMSAEPLEVRLPAGAVLLAVLMAVLFCSSAFEGRAAKIAGRVVDTAAVALAVLAAMVFYKARQGEIFGWALLGLQVAMNFRVRSRRDVLFDLLCSFGMLLLATRTVGGIAMLLLTMAFVAGSVLALAAKYFLEQLERYELVDAGERHWRLAAPGAVLFGLLPAFAIALPIIALLPSVPHHPLPLELPTEGILHAEPPPTGAGKEGSGGGMIGSIKGLFGSDGEEGEGLLPGERAAGKTGKGVGPSGGGVLASIKGLFGSKGEERKAKGASGPGPDPGETPGGTHHADPNSQGEKSAGEKPGSQDGSPGDGKDRAETPADEPQRPEGSGEGKKQETGQAAGADREPAVPGPGTPAKAGQAAEKKSEKQEKPGKTNDAEKKTERDEKKGPSKGKEDEAREKVDPEKAKAKERIDAPPTGGNRPIASILREHPGNVCVPAEPKPRPPKRDVCQFHVLNPYHHPALYPRDADPESSTVMRVKSAAPVYLRTQVYDRYHDRGAWDCSTGAVEVKPRSAFRYYFNDRNNKQVWNIDIAVEKPLTNMVPMALRPEFARYALRGLTINPDHAVAAPKPLERGTRYYEESIVRVWGTRPTSDDDRRPVEKSYLEIPEEALPAVTRAVERVPGRRDATLRRAAALEGYLRGQHRHSLDKLSLQGQSVEPMLDFLEGSKEGNAELFATALALMARYEGIPARVVVGHVASRQPVDEAEYFVHGLDAHTWTELYVDGHWTTFDATPIHEVPALAYAQSASKWRQLVTYARSLDRLATAFDEVVADAGVPGTAWEAASTVEEQWIVRVWRALRWLGGNWALVVAAVVAAALLGWLIARRREALRRLRFSLTLMDPRERIVETFAELERLAAGRGRPRPPTVNHSAYVETLGAAYPTVAAPIARIGVEFGRARYGCLPVEEATAKEVASAYEAATRVIALAPQFVPESRPLGGAPKVRTAAEPNAPRRMPRRELATEETPEAPVEAEDRRRAPRRATYRRRHG